MRSRRLPPDPYNRCITFIYGTTADFDRFMRRRYDDEVPLGASCRGHHAVRISKRGYASDYLFLRKVGSREEQMIFLAHESLHLVHNALRVAGLPLTEDTVEAYTYYQGWVMSQCARHMR